MKPQAIVFLVVVAAVAGAAVMYVQFGGSSVTPPEQETAQAPPAESQEAPPAQEAPEDDFIAEARRLAEKTGESSVAGTQPGADADPSLVPVIEVEPAGEYDFGVVPREGMSHGEVKVYNRGKADLKITKVSTSCGCTKVNIPENEKTVAPGEFATVKVTIDPKRIPGFYSKKTITVMSSDPKNPSVKIDVIARIDPEFLLEPEMLDFGEVAKGEPLEATMLFRQIIDVPITIKNVRVYTNSENMDVSFAERPKDQWEDPEHVEYTISVKVSEYTSPGIFNGRFGIETTCPRVRMFPVSVKANIKSFYKVAPASRLTIRSHPRLEGPAKANTSITADRPFEILDIKTSAEDLTAELKPGRAPNSSIIELALKEGAAPGHRNETLEFSVKAGDDVLKERVPVRVLVSGAPRTAPSVPLKRSDAKSGAAPIKRPNITRKPLPREIKRLPGGAAGLKPIIAKPTVRQAAPGAKPAAPPAAKPPAPAPEASAGQ